MIITEVKASDAGDYSCSAVNKFGTAKSDAKVTVVCKFDYFFVYIRGLVWC